MALNCAKDLIKRQDFWSAQNTSAGTMRKWSIHVGTIVANNGKEQWLVNMANADYYMRAAGPLS